MFTAKQKRDENIAEYILYIWQLEDLLRALRFDEDSIYKTLVEPCNVDAQSKESLHSWYVGICDLLIEEGKIERGHLDHTTHLIADLYDLHLLLLKSSAGASYVPLFLELAPHLERLKGMIKESVSNDIELCFRALYGMMLQRIKSKDKFDKDVLELVSPTIAMLSHLYIQIEHGEIDPYKEDDK